MTRGNKSTIREALTSIISPQLIRRRAKKLRAVKRERRVDIVALVYTLVLGFDRGAKRTLASFRRAYAVATGTTLASSAFYDRFSPELAELMRQLVAVAFERLVGAAKLTGVLASFARIAIADGSRVRLHDALEKDYPSVWTNHTKASAKLHVVIDGATRTPIEIKIVPGSCHDLGLLSIDETCRGTLFVFDLAYYQGRLFRKIIDAKADFLCRVKKDASFLITHAADPAFVGRRHRDIVQQLEGQSFQVQIEHEYRHRQTKHGPGPRDLTKYRVPLRLIGIWCAELGRHRLYLTSASEQQLAADAVPSVYAMRWEIELLFRELKTQLRIEQMPSGSKAISECLLDAALLSLAVARGLQRFASALPNIPSLATERCTAVMRAILPRLLDLLCAPPNLRADIEKRVRRILAREAPDPNVGRMLLLKRAQILHVSPHPTAA